MKSSEKKIRNQATSNNVKTFCVLVDKLSQLENTLYKNADVTLEGLENETRFLALVQHKKESKVGDLKKRK